MQAYSKEIFSLLAPLFVWAVNRIFQPKAKLIRSTRYAFTYLIQEPLKAPDGAIIKPTQTVNTASISIYNAGVLPAKAVEIVFNWKPQHFNVWPSRAYSHRLSDDNRFSILLDDLAPKELFGIELISVNDPLPDLVNARSEQCAAVDQTLNLQPILSRWKTVVIGWLMLSGLIFSVYLALTALQFALN